MTDTNTDTHTESQPFGQPPLTFDPDRPDRNIVRQCRSLTPRGVPCRQACLRGEDYCVAHFERQPRAFERPGHIAIPLLEDPSAIQLTCTKIVHAVANELIQPTAANSMVRACAVAASTLPRPARLRPSDQTEPRQEPGQFAVDPFGAWIGPQQPLLDKSGKLSRYDDLAVRVTNQDPDPAATITNSYKQLILQLVDQRADRETAESAAARAAGLPEPYPGRWNGFKTGNCAFLTAFCNGPSDPEHACSYCAGEKPMSPTHEYYPGAHVVSIIDAFRHHLQQQGALPNQAEPTTVPVPDLNAAGMSSATIRVPHISAVGDVGLTRPRARHHSVNVVKLVTTATHHIPKDKKLVPQKKHKISPKIATQAGPTTWPERA